MALSLLLVLAWASCSHGNPGSPDVEAAAAIVSQFRSFVQAHDKTYDDEAAFATRMGIFASNVAFINAFNRNASVDGVRLAVNQFADLTALEFKQMYLSGLTAQPSISTATASRSKDFGVTVPDEIDWRTKGAVTPVGDQKNCGGCWAFSAAEAIEGAWFLAGHPLVSLSEQELVDCSAGWKGGCAGGHPSDAFDWVKNNGGICSNKSYPWTAFQDECHNQFMPCKVAAKIDGYEAVRSNDEHGLKVAVAQQPVSVLIEADTDIFRFYKSGVLKNSGCGYALDHAVLAVGYGTDSGQAYWLVKNSWNSSWGEHGYVRLARTDSDNSAGECGIAMQATYPVVNRETLVV